MKRLKYCCLCLFVLIASASAFAQTNSYSPKPGGVERKAILDALRAPVEQELKQKIVFKVDHLKVHSGWAFIRGVPQQPDGTAVDYNISKYKQAIDEGMFDDWICALLRKEDKNWRVVKYVIGATDVAYEGWDVEFKAPKGIFR